VPSPQQAYKRRAIFKDPVKIEDPDDTSARKIEKRRERNRRNARLARERNQLHLSKMEAAEDEAEQVAEKLSAEIAEVSRELVSLVGSLPALDATEGQIIVLKEAFEKNSSTVMAV
jgi:hypothetical protein